MSILGLSYYLILFKFSNFDESMDKGFNFVSYYNIFTWPI